MKLAVITGSNGQLGREMAKVFKSRDWHVFGIDVTSPCKESKHDFFYSGDVSIRSTFADVFTRIDRINHNLEKISL